MVSVSVNLLTTQWIMLNNNDYRLHFGRRFPPECLFAIRLWQLDHGWFHESFYANSQCRPPYLPSMVCLLIKYVKITDPDTAWMEFEAMVQARYDELLAALLNFLFSGGDEVRLILLSISALSNASPKTTTVTVTETESITVNPSTAAVVTSVSPRA